MLGKLIKQEFRATARIMLPVSGAVLVLALLANLSIRGLSGNMSNVPALRMLLAFIVFAYGAAIVAAAVMAMVIMINRFYRNLLKDEGYLMFTLPVSVHELVWAKLIVSLVWFLVTGLLIALVCSATALNISHTSLAEVFREMPSWSEIRDALKELGVYNGLIGLTMQGILAILLSILALCLHFYAAMSLGHMFSKEKILLSIVFFVVISFAFSMMQTGISIAGFEAIDRLHPVLDSQNGIHDFMMLAWIFIGMKLIQSAVLYFATVLSLKRGLNLE
ncbi:MAG: hypothetical protein IJI13_09095 [Oscillospiraceae bacterium]|jgi:hypothetical protein|nr:hypothetical protein [Oscillospiraceae bacterium]MDO5458162.1 hypothetical protein [Eubacteriales bacterium]MBQ1579028.1 hypothetical protein [Oscillospiraceae bacterium]MBQ5787217.1 hypothetical protein [Oscillospiraceae bacterium]MBQ6317669.1 hypothetical protein [Oscillospiraceae bacterium]